jgi:hypothetical protein
MSTKEVTMSLRKNERCPIHNSFFCCRWKQLWRQREFASPVREGINQIRACRFWRGIPKPTSQETRVPPPDSTPASPAEETAAPQEFPGIWQSQSLVNTRGLCGLHSAPTIQRRAMFCSTSAVADSAATAVADLFILATRVAKTSVPDGMLPVTRARTTSATSRSWV